LPPALLSRPLRQRHHFLGLTPDDGAEYSAWPSADQSRAVFLLHSDPVPPVASPPTVAYSADPEYITAHVRITPALRLLFLLDPDAGWLYHNVALMPFPPAADPSFDRAYAIYADDFLPEPQYALTVDDDYYWDSYAGPDDGDAEPDPAKADAHDHNLNAEDAYWAQYSAVQGSGDSTLPSPRPGKDKNYSATEGRIIVPSDDLQIPRAAPYNPLQPPEPDALASRLAALAMHPRSGAASPPLVDVSPHSDTDSSTASAPTSEEGALGRPADAPTLVGNEHQNQPEDQDALRDHVKSLYTLWRAGRPGVPAEQDKALFLATVQRAL
ncbi:hypothetical protein HYPSUDRAFT_95982, partial [Hypholoma sublateritium FD-334 SS-4]